MEAPQAEMSVGGRILRVFYAPSETFEAVAEQRSAADWLVPTIVVALAIFFSTYLTSPIYVAEAMEQIRGQTPRRTAQCGGHWRRHTDQWANCRASYDVCHALYWRCDLSLGR